MALGATEVLVFNIIQLSIKIVFHHSASHGCPWPNKDKKLVTLRISTEKPGIIFPNLWFIWAKIWNQWTKCKQISNLVRQSISREVERYLLTDAAIHKRYVKIDMLEWHKKGVGLEYFDIERLPNTSSGNKIQNKFFTSLKKIKFQIDMIR